MKLSEWTEGLTVHGVRYIFLESGSKFSRIFWTVAIIFSISGLCFDSFLLYQKLNIKPDINVRVGHKSTKKIPFPAITVCNPLFAKNSLVNYFDISKQWRLNPKTNLNLTIQEQSYLAANIQACDPHSSAIFQSKTSKCSQNDIVKLLNESSLSISEALKVCDYKRRTANCTKLFNRVLTDRGFCYSFNMQSFSTIFNEKTISKDFHCYKNSDIAKSLFPGNKLYNESSIDENDAFRWTVDFGYDELHETDSVPIKSSKGKSFAFNPYLRESDASNVCIIHGNVFSLFLHLPNEIMLPSHQENYVAFKRKKEILITAKSYTADESMRKFEPESRGCYFEDEKKLKFFKTYTKALCEFECLTNYTLKMCGCVKFSMPRTQATPVCPLEKVECYVEAMNAWPDYEQTKDRFEANCGCLKTCNDIKYEFKFEKISTTENVFVVYDVLNLSKSDIISRAVFTFDDFEVLEYEEYATYKIQNFIADIGGLLGFFLGCSILSIIEVAYFVTDVIFSKLKNLCRRKDGGKSGKIQT